MESIERKIDIDSARSVLTIALNNLKLAQDKYLELLDNKLHC